jgi:hypothetical protein
MATDQNHPEREPEDYPTIEDAYKALPRETRIAILNGDQDALATWQRAAGYIEEET